MAAWDRQRNEPPVAFDCFCYYRDMLADRTIEGAFKLRRGEKMRGSGARHWFRWSTKYKWVERAKLYDEHLDFIKKISQENAMKDAGKEIAQLRVLHKQGEAAMSRAMAARVLDILNHPLYREKTHEKTETSEDGRKITNIFVIKKPARFSYNTAALLAMAASKIGRAGLDIGEDDTDIAPEDFNKSFFKSDVELAKALPPGVVPEIPADPSAPPVLHIPEANADLQNSVQDRPKPARPGNNGANGNGHT